MNRGCSHVFTWHTLAHEGGQGGCTVHGAYSARRGSQSMAARMPADSKFWASCSVKTSVPVPVRMLGNQTPSLSLRATFIVCRLVAAAWRQRGSGAPQGFVTDSELMHTR